MEQLIKRDTKSLHSLLCFVLFFHIVFKKAIVLKHSIINFNLILILIFIAARLINVSRINVIICIRKEQLS